MKLRYRYEIVEGRPLLGEPPWTLLREMRLRSRRLGWLFDCRIGTYATREEAEAALAALTE